MIAYRDSAAAVGAPCPAATTMYRSASRTKIRMSATTCALLVNKAAWHPPPTGVPATLPLTIPCRKRTRSAPVATTSSLPERSTSAAPVRS